MCKSSANKVKVAVSDIDGVLRGKYLHIDKFLGAAQPHPAYEFRAFYEAAKKRGFILYPGKLTQVETFRVGCIGAIGRNEMQQAVNAVADTLREMGIASGEPAI